MKIELHSHSKYSKGTKVDYDGVEEPRAMVKAAKEKGLDAIAITDHNEIIGAQRAKQYEKKYGIKVIIGEEVSTKGGHILAIGIKKKIRPGMSAEDTVKQIHKQKGIAIAPHPFDIKQMGLHHKAVLCDAIEVFNSINMERVGNRLSYKFAKKHKIPAVSGSDAHSVSMVGNAATILHSKGIIDALKKGKTSFTPEYASTSQIVEWALKRLGRSNKNVIKYIDKNYKQPKNFIAKIMLRIATKRPDSLRPLFNLMGYVALFAFVWYGILNKLFFN